MKIVCDSCSTKYSISDDKVRGKVFKIRCKKCSHIIVVKGNVDAVPAAAEAASEAVWHLVVDGDQVGPLTDADVRARLTRNEITPENYVWKEGFADWLRLAEVPEFASVGASPPVAGELFSDSGAADATDVGDRSSDLGGLFGSGGGAPELVHAPGHAAPSILSAAAGRHRSAPVVAPPEDDAFSIPTPSASSPAPEAADLFGAVAPQVRVESGRVRGGRSTNGAAPAMAGRHDGGRVENLTAQRSENSVLFSLSNLQSLAAPAPTAKPGTVQSTEGSGLIDIRAMAASTMRAPSAGGMGGGFGDDSRRAEDDLPAFGAFSSAAPVLLSIPSSSGPPKWIYPVVGGVTLLAIGLIVLAVSILNRPVVVEQPAAAPVTAPTAAEPNEPKKKPTPAAATEGSAPTATTVAAADLPPRENAEGGEKGADKDKGLAEKGFKGPKKLRGIRRSAFSGDTKPAGGSTAAGAGAAAAPADPEKVKPAKGSLDDLLEGALNGRKARPKVDDDSPGGRKNADTGAAGGGPLTKTAVVAGMNSVKGKVAACYTQYKVPGLAMVNVVIGKSGKVSSATVTGKFAGTPTGTCVEGAVKSASFPPSDGLTTPYPFSLR